MNGTQKPNLPYRRTVRLHTYDYRKPGYYFVTICTQNKKCLFGNIVDDRMHLNSTGSIVQSTWEKVPHSFAHVALDYYVVMPNHFHGILVFDGPEVPHETLSQVPERFKTHLSETKLGENVLNLASSTTVDRNKQAEERRQTPTVGEVVRTFKAAATRHIHSTTLPDFAWQSRYYESIIGHEKTLQAVLQYIIDNPARWNIDKLYMR